MSSLPFGAPFQVSPLIRGARWALFIAGFFYGLSKQQIYNIMEASWREEEAVRKIARDKHMAILKEKIRQEEIKSVKLMETGELFDQL